MCLLDDRFSEKLQEAIKSEAECLIERKDCSLDQTLVLRLEATGFQSDLAKFVELRQNGAAVE